MNLIRKFLGALILLLVSGQVHSLPILYATGTSADGTSGIFTLDTNTGQATLVGLAGENITEGGLAAHDSTNTLSSLGLTGSTAALFDIDPVTGAATISSIFEDTGAYGMWYGGLTYDQSAGLYYATGQSTIFSSRPNRAVSTFFTIDPSTGLATAVGATGSAGLVNGDLAYDSVNDILYATGTLGSTDSALFVIDPLTGETSLVGSTGDAEVWAGGLAYDPLLDVLFATGIDSDDPAVSYSTLFSLDPTTGSATKIGATSGLSLHRGGLAILSSSVPEPETPLRCDTNDDGTVDIYDIRMISLNRNQLATGPDDPMDWDENGEIDILDARGCQQACTLPRCAAP